MPTKNQKVVAPENIKLTPKERRFCENYIRYNNGALAARMAGYPEKNARNIAYQLLAKLHIQNEIKILCDELDAKDLMSFREVIRNLTLAATGEMEEEIIVMEKQPDGSTKAKIEKKKVNGTTRVKALDVLTKRYDIFNKFGNTSEDLDEVDGYDNKD